VSSRAPGISDASVIKDDGLFFLCRNDGSVGGHEGHGLGLYFHDCRYLSRYELRIRGRLPESLLATSGDGFRSVFQLTNPELPDKRDPIHRQELTLRWRHIIDSSNGSLADELELHNHDTREHSFPITLSFEADFTDVGVIRGLVEPEPHSPPRSKWKKDALSFSEKGLDGRTRMLLVRFSEAPRRVKHGEVTFEVTLPPQGAKHLLITLTVGELDESSPRDVEQRASHELHDFESDSERAMSEWLDGFSRVRSNSTRLDWAMERSLRDLRALRNHFDGEHFISAGLPWFATLFGRDSLICAMQTLAFRPQTTAETLQLLASLQGLQNDSWKEEEPGKILHELRVGELARAGKIPHTPFYGSVDATPLFLIALELHSRWTGSLELFRELRPAAEAAMGWIERFGPPNGDGYIDYTSEIGADGSIVNQAWKDSGNGIVGANGEVAAPPLALIEVQAYAYQARRALARLYELDGDELRAAVLRADAEKLRVKFDRDFWLPTKQFFALALSGRDRKPLEVISSNPGHALWSGILTDERAELVARRLLADDMFSGWGVRTLSKDERGYNPVGYHLGTVWPHDNSLIVAGLRRYGHDDEALRIFDGLLSAAALFDNHRLPETFSGFSRARLDAPVRYPVACHPQAWAAGSLPFMLQVLLGLEPDAFAKRLTIVRPRLPQYIERLELTGLRVGEASVDLKFVRENGQLTVQPENKQGSLEVVTSAALARSWV
jgi:glycogen debranching enzyme